MSLHAHSIHVEELVSLPKPRGENAKANQPLSAHRQATCSVIMIREVRLGACARRSHTREFNAHPGGCHQWGAMTGCPQLRVDESVVAKPIPAILCCPDWDDAKGVKATAGSNDVVHRGVSGTEAATTASMREPSVQHVVDGSAC
jgi:hypothetical protein